MSLNLIREILIRPGCLNGSAWSLFMAMANRADDDGTGIWESMPNLAKHGGITRSTAWRVLPKLLASGLVIDTGNGKPTKRGGSPTNIYRIDLAKLASIECEKNQVSKLPGCQIDRLPASQDDTLGEEQRPNLEPQRPKMRRCQHPNLELPASQFGTQTSPLTSPVKTEKNVDDVVQSSTGKKSKARGSGPLIANHSTPCLICHGKIQIGEEITFDRETSNGKVYKHFSCSPPSPAPVPDPACPKCHGDGQLKPYYDAQGNPICPPCPCLSRVGGQIQC